MIRIWTPKTVPAPIRDLYEPVEDVAWFMEVSGESVEDIETILRRSPAIRFCTRIYGEGRLYIGLADRPNIDSHAELLRVLSSESDAGR
jgi:hypothetical protein